MLEQGKAARDSENRQTLMKIREAEFAVVTLKVEEAHNQKDLESARKQLEAVKTQSRQAMEQRDVIRQRLAETEIQVGILKAELNEMMSALAEEENQLKALQMELDRIKRLQKTNRAELADWLALEKELMAKGSTEDEIEVGTILPTLCTVSLTSLYVYLYVLCLSSAKLSKRSWVRFDIRSRLGKSC